MTHLRAMVVIDSPLVRVGEVACSAPPSSWGPEEAGTAVEVVLPRRGVFVVSRKREVRVADPTTVLLFGGRNGAQRVSHPRAGGDVCTVLSVAPDALEDALGDSPRDFAVLSGAARPQVRLMAARLAARRSKPESGGELLAGEVAALHLVEVLADQLASAAPVVLGPAQRRRVDAVRELLAGDPTRRWRLGSVADTVGCSPYHLARQFRLATGMTVHQYLEGVRLATALERILDGERDLSRLAVELGFGSHSHMTSRFRHEFGATPRDVRKILTAPTSG